MTRFACIALVLLVSAVPLGAQGLVNTVVSGNEVSTTLSLPGGLGAGLTIRFEEVVGLTTTNLGLSAEVLNPFSWPLLSRLSGALLPGGFPVMIRIAPPTSGGLSFSGVVSVDIHTHNLNFLSALPLRFFAATPGGPFSDITVSAGAGSYRACGNKGGFSDFLIVLDLRPVDWVIKGKFNQLKGILESNEGRIAPAVYDDLADLLDDARDEYDDGHIAASVEKVEDFIAEVEQHSGADIPDVWRSARDLVNVAGYLRSAAGTLRFSLNLKRGV